MPSGKRGALSQNDKSAFIAETIMAQNEKIIRLSDVAHQTTGTGPTKGYVDSWSVVA